MLNPGLVTGEIRRLRGEIRLDEMLSTELERARGKTVPIYCENIFIYTTFCVTEQ